MAAGAGALYGRKGLAMEGKNSYGLSAEQILEESRYQIEAEGLRLGDFYDADLFEHCTQVAVFSIMLGIQYRLDMHTLILLGMGGLLHDIGKSQIARQILDKPNGLSDSEYQLIQAHPTMGYRMLQEYHFPKEVTDMVLYHHERLDGRGYPTGCREVSITVQLLAVADVYAAVSAKRCYHNSRSHEEALIIMEQEQGLNHAALRLLHQLTD